jgi:hypothetical protein
MAVPTHKLNFLNDMLRDPFITLVVRINDCMLSALWQQQTGTQKKLL